ncbi:Metallo-dependent phosphatase-like protein [Chytriomyces sp. MP71]|nr:Metallo-dependent phosphatase-like protein [Chytriomyces sp. MP71]
MGLPIDECISLCMERKLLSETIVREICEQAKSVLLEEGNVRSVSAPCVVVGDVHGQFYDVLEIFRIAGRCPDTNYVFLGDYVDRGFYSVETILLLVCLKIRWPSRVTLVRGNHESRAVTQTYGFYAECMRKYGSSSVWAFITDFFDYLVLAVVIEDSIFCVHGGLSPSVHTLDQIRMIDRFREIPHEGAMADLVWSDPAPNTHLPNPRFTGTGEDTRSDFQISPRGAGYLFGKQVTRQFLTTNNLSHVCRAHQLCMEGFQILFDDLVSTVWSAPNYCYRAGNMASVLQIGPELERFFNVFGPAPEDARESPIKEAFGGGGGVAFDDDDRRALKSRGRRGSGGTLVGGMVREAGEGGFSNPVSLPCVAF